ncbi:putative ACR [uncultured archaeon]|nr:putative ACR [uncultured archaeon]
MQMKLSNLTRKKSLRADIEMADNDLLRMRGLMFRPKVVPILFIFDSPGLFPIHSHFCPGEFDAVYVNEKRKVVELFRRVPVGLDRVSPMKTASFLLELPPEMTDGLGIRIGDSISWGMGSPLGKKGREKGLGEK